MLTCGVVVLPLCSGGMFRLWSVLLLFGFGWWVLVILFWGVFMVCFTDVVGVITCLLLVSLGFPVDECIFCRCVGVGIICCGGVGCLLWFGAFALLWDCF